MSTAAEQDCASAFNELRDTRGNLNERQSNTTYGWSGSPSSTLRCVSKMKSPPPTAAEGEKTYPDDPKERYEMKRQAAEMEKKPVAKAKVATEPNKRTGELRIDPPGAKVKPNPAQGTKRTAETAVEDLDPRVEESPKKTGTLSYVPETPPAGWKPDAASLVKEKEIAKQHLRKTIQGTYEANGIEITEQEIRDIAHLSVQMSAVDIMEIRAPATGPCLDRGSTGGRAEVDQKGRRQGRRAYITFGYQPKASGKETPGRPLVDARSTPGRTRLTDLSGFLCRMFKNIVFYSVSWPSAATTFAEQGAGGVGYACRADRVNRGFVGVGHALTTKAEHVLQDDLTEALKRTQHSPRYGTHSRKMTRPRSQIWET